VTVYELMGTQVPSYDKGCLIIGAGGHGKVIADIMLCQGMKVLGFLDDNPPTIGQRILGLPVLGNGENLMDFGLDGVVVGVGDNTSRHKIVQRMELYDTPAWITALHPKATVANSVQIGAGTVIMAGVIVNPDTIIGRHAIINTGATVDHDCLVGDFAHIAPGVHLAGGVRVGASTLIGIGATVIPYCTIGTGVTVGAGAVVVKDIPDGVTAKGIPATW
jgi:sugar O-acyltransferase (sialic acid O-acetyltransferase NeuD family)